MLDISCLVVVILLVRTKFQDIGTAVEDTFLTLNPSVSGEDGLSADYFAISTIPVNEHWAVAIVA